MIASQQLTTRSIAAVIALALCGFGSVFAAAPANDNFANAIDLGSVSSFSTTGNNIGATLETNDPGVGGAGGTIWYKWTSTTARLVQIDTNGSAVNSFIGVFTGSLPALSLVEKNTSAFAHATTNSYVKFFAGANTTYFIALDSGTQHGALQVNLLPVPANDNFANATPIAGNVVVAGNNTNATSEAGEPIASKASVWYAWTAPTNATVSVNLPNDLTFSMLLTVYSGTAVGTLHEETDTQSYPYTFQATAGTTYHFAVSGSYMSAFTFAVTIGDGQPGAPVNDNFAMATVESGATFNVNGTTVGATKEASEPAAAGKGLTVWYDWTAPSSGAVALSAITGNFNYNLDLDVYTGSTLATLTAVMSGVNQVNFNAVAGTLYHIRVDSDFDLAGTAFTLSLGAPPINDNVANATVLTGSSFTVAADSTGATIETGETVGLSGTVWYTWTAPATARVTFQVATFFFSASIFAYTGDGFANFAQVKDASSPTIFGAVSFDATQGTKYTIVVGGVGGKSGGGPFTLFLNTTPANDNFAASIAISGSPVAQSGSLAAATVESGEPVTNVGSHTVWYNWTASTSGPVTLAASQSSAAATGGINTGLLQINTAVYTGSAINALTFVASADGGLTGSTLIAPGSLFTATAGTTYQIAVCSDQNVNFLLTLVQRPLNDDFANATTIAGALPLTTTGSLIAATLEAGEPSGVPLSLQAIERFGSIWYKYTATESHRMSLELSGILTGQVVVFTGNAVNALTLVSSAQPTLVMLSLTSSVEFDAVAGTTYYFDVLSEGIFGFGTSATLILSEANVAVTSPLTATPLPAVAGDPLTFSVGTNASGASYAWDFGDGTTISTTTGTTTHAYATAGTYQVNLVASVPNGTSVSDSVSVTVIAKKELGLTKASITLNFPKPGTDAIALSGTINLAPGVVSGPLTINIGGLSQTVTLANGAFKSKTQSVKITAPKAGTANGKFAISLKGSFQAAFAAQGLTSAVVKGKAIVLPVQLIYNGVSSEFTLDAAYTSTGKKGVAK